MRSVHIRGRRYRGEAYEDGAEMRPQAKERQQPPETGRGKDSSPEPEGAGLRGLSFWPPELRG